MNIKRKIHNYLWFRQDRKLKRNKISIYRNANIKNTKFCDGGRICIGKYSILNNCVVGRYSYVGNNCILPSSNIGAYTSIGDRVIIISGRHPTSNFVSTHPAFYSIDYINSYVTENKFDEHNYYDENNKTKINIGNDVWIGNDVRIFEGVKIGDGAVI